MTTEIAGASKAPDPRMFSTVRIPDSEWNRFWNVGELLKPQYASAMALQDARMPASMQAAIRPSCQGFRSGSDYTSV
jgi:hypothetical protein